MILKTLVLFVSLVGAAIAGPGYVNITMDNKTAEVFNIVSGYQDRFTAVVYKANHEDIIEFNVKSTITSEFDLEYLFNDNVDYIECDCRELFFTSPLGFNYESRYALMYPSYSTTVFLEEGVNYRFVITTKSINVGDISAQGLHLKAVK